MTSSHFICGRLQNPVEMSNPKTELEQFFVRMGEIIINTAIDFLS